ncbi:MAG: tetratricopeptide repeat protein [Deltaproteobacteria bacterium]|nr:tetratricopeptide repeat protein [Deltaproteobacteria bacterium]
MEISNDLLNKILHNGPSQATLFLILSRMRDEGHLEEVIRECEKALDLYPDAIRIRQLLAEVCIEAGQISKAESELESITSDIDKLAPSYRMLSNLYNRQKKQEESARAQRLYIAHRPDDQEAIDLLETLQPQEPSLELDEEPETETEIAEAADLPEIATSTLAEIYFNQGQIPEALETYERVVSRNPDDNRARQRLEELKRTLEPEEPVEANGKKERIRIKKEKMISVLEKWLAKLREQSESYASV